MGLIWPGGENLLDILANILYSRYGIRCEIKIVEGAGFDERRNRIERQRAERLREAEESQT